MALLLALLLVVWALVTVEGWTWERPALAGPPLDRAPGWVLRHALDTQSVRPHYLPAVVPSTADHRPLVGCVQRWPDLDDVCPACGTVVVLRCRGPPPRTTQPRSRSNGPPARSVDRSPAASPCPRAPTHPTRRRATTRG